MAIQKTFRTNSKNQKNNMVTIKANKKDFNSIKEIYLEGVVDEFHTQYSKKSKEKIFKESFVKERLNKIKKGINSKKDLILISKENSNVVGFGHFKISKEHIGWLDKGYVKKEFRKKGVAKTIIQEAMKWFNKKNIKTLRAAIFVNNIPSSNLIKSFGFKPRHLVWEKSI